MQLCQPRPLLQPASGLEATGVPDKATEWCWGHLCNPLHIPAADPGPGVPFEDWGSRNYSRYIDPSFESRLLSSCPPRLLKT